MFLSEPTFQWVVSFTWLDLEIHRFETYGPSWNCLVSKPILEISPCRVLARIYTISHPNTTEWTSSYKISDVGNGPIDDFVAEDGHKTVANTQRKCIEEL